MKKIFLFSALLIVVFCPGIFAQKQVEGHWGKQYLDVAYANAATNDGGYILTGLTKNGIDDPNGDIVVIKISAAGDTTWTLVYGGPNLEGGNAVIQTADGGYMVSGHTEDFGARDCDAFMMKLDKNGARQWFKIFGGEQDDISESIVELPDGSFVFAGITASYGNSNNSSDVRHVYFVKTNSVGDTTWTKYYAGAGAEYACSIVNMPGGGFLSAGWSTSFGKGEHDGWLLRLNDNGDTLWTRLYKNIGDTRLYKILPTADKGFIIAGFTTQTSTCKPQGLIIKLDADGNELWKRTYGDTTENIVLHDVAQLPNGNFIFTGSSYAADTTGNVYILTTNDKGEKITDELCGGAASGASCIAVQGNNSFLVAGSSAKFGDSHGDLYWMEMDNTISGIPSVKVSTARIYPNPVKDQSVIILPASEAFQLCRIEIKDLNGRTLYSQENIAAKDILIHRNALLPGVYVFRIACMDGKIYNGRFTVD